MGLGEKDAHNVEDESWQQRARELIATAPRLLAAVRLHYRDRRRLRIGEPQLAGARDQVRIFRCAEIVDPSGGRKHFHDEIWDDVERPLDEPGSPCRRPPGQIGRQIILITKTDKDILQKQTTVPSRLLPAAYREEELALRRCRLPPEGGVTTPSPLMSSTADRQPAAACSARYSALSRRGCATVATLTILSGLGPLGSPGVAHAHPFDLRRGRTWMPSPRVGSSASTASRRYAARTCGTGRLRRPPGVIVLC
jgi:hypothetical protein